MKKNEFVGLITIITIVIVVFGLPYAVGQHNIHVCADLAESTGRNTRWQDECQVEIAPRLWVDEREIVYYLDFVEAAP